MLEYLAQQVIEELKNQGHVPEPVGVKPYGKHGQLITFVQHGLFEYYKLHEQNPDVLLEPGPEIQSKDGKRIIPLVYVNSIPCVHHHKMVAAVIMTEPWAWSTVGQYFLR